MAELLLNPWVIIIIVISVVIGNIAALKYTANMKFHQSSKKKSDLDKLNELDKQRVEETANEDKKKDAD